MMTIDDLAKLKALDAKLEPIRHRSGVAFDMSNAAMWWASLGERLVTNNTRTNFPGCTAEEAKLMQELREFHGSALDEDQDYIDIMTLGARVIAEAKVRTLDPGGHLGMLRVVRDAFAFLQPEFGLRPTRAHIDEADYSSDTMMVTLRFPILYDSGCSIRKTSEPGTDYLLEDLLFMSGKRDPLIPLTDLKLTSEKDVETWFTSVAGLLRRYGRAVLTDEPGAFDRLAASTEERNRLIDERNTRLHGGDGYTSHVP